MSGEGLWVQKVNEKMRKKQQGNGLLNNDDTIPYTQRTLVIEPRQETRIGDALKKKTGVVIKVRKPLMEGEHSPMALTHDTSGRSASKGILHLTPAQMEKYDRGHPGSVISLKFSNRHLQENLRHRGGFIPLLAALLAPVIGGVAGGLIEKEIAGSGLHHSPPPRPPPPSPPPAAPTLVWCKRSDGGEGGSGSGSGSGSSKPPAVIRIQPDSSGKGLHLCPWKSANHHKHFTSGYGLYYSPYKRSFKGGGSMMIKLDKHRLPSHCSSHFSKSQRKCIASLLQ